MTTVDRVESEIRAELGGLDRDLRSMEGKYKQSFKSVERDAEAFGQRMGKVIAAGLTVATVAAGAFGNSVLKAASTSEQFSTRLRVMLGSMEEGNRLFQNMATYASRVPFEFEAVMQAATNMATVMEDGVDDITRFMPLIGDIAAATGLSVQQASEQFTRAWSAGAGAAELFRERGVNAVLGFQAGATVSAEETRKALEAALIDPMFKFAGAAYALGSTYEGLTSMLSDKWFKFRNDVADAGAFELIKMELEDLNETLDNTDWSSFAKDLSDSFIDVWFSVKMTMAVIEDFASVFDGIGGIVPDAVGERLESISLAFDLFTQSVKNQAKEIAGSDSEVAKVEAQYAELMQRIHGAKDASDAFGAGMERAGKKAAKSTGDASKEIDKFRSKLSDMLEDSQVEALTAGFSDLEKELFDVDLFIRKNAESFAALGVQGERMVSTIKQNIRNLHAYTEAQEQAKEAAEALAKQEEELRELLLQPFENAIRNIQDLFSDTFQDIFEGGIDNAEDFADQARRIFTKLAAELASMLVMDVGLRGIVGGAGGGASGGGSNLLSSASSLIGKTGIGGAIDAFGASALPSLFGQTAVVGAAGPELAATGLLSGAGVGLSALALPVAALALPALLGAFGGTPDEISGFSARLGRGGIASSSLGSKGIGTAGGQQLLDAAAGFFEGLAQTTGIDLSGTRIEGSFSKKQGNSLVLGAYENNPLAAELGTVRVAFGEGADEMSEAFGKLTVEMIKASGAANDNLNTALANIQTEGRKAEEVLADIAFASNFENLGEMPDIMSDLEKQFNALAETAERLGLSVEHVKEVMADRFDKDVARQLLAIVDPIALKTMEINAQFDAMVDDAKLIGANVSQVEKLRELTLLEIGGKEDHLDSLRAAVNEASQMVSLFTRLKESISNTLDDLLYGSNSALNNEQKLAGLRQEAFSLSGKTDAASLERINEIVPMLLDISRQSNATGAGFVSDFDLGQALLSQALAAASGQVLGAHNQLSSAQANLASAQQDAAAQQVAALRQEMAAQNSQLYELVQQSVANQYGRATG